MSNSSMKKMHGILFGKWYLRTPKVFFQIFDNKTANYLSSLIEWQAHLIAKDQIHESGEFFMTQQLIKFQIGLSKHEQQSSLKQLKDKNIILVTKRGLPPKNYYTIDYDKLYEIVISSMDSNTNSSPIEVSPMERFEPQQWDGLRTNYGAVGVPTVEPSPTHPLIRIKDNKKEKTFFSKEKNDTPCGVSLGFPLGKSKLIPVKKQRRIRQDVMKVISYWNNSPRLHRHYMPTSPDQPMSKVLDKIITTVEEVIDGKFLTDWKPYTVEDIIRAIDGFKIRLTDPNYQPVNKLIIKNINLSNFFWNSFASWIQSMFLECLNNPPKLVKNTIPKEDDINPQITIWLEELYVEKVLLGQPKVFNQMEKNKFIRGANMLSISMESLRSKANLVTGPYEFCEYVINALLQQWAPSEIKPGNIGSLWTYTELLPRYLVKIGRIETESQSTEQENKPSPYQRIKKT